MTPIKLLVVASEYPPYGSGIANVVENIVKKFREKGIECTICTPFGPDIRLGSWRLIQKTGVLGLLYFWYKVSRFFISHNYDMVWLHNPFFIRSNPFHKCIVTMHSTYHGESTQIEGTPLFLRIYRSVVSLLERHCLTRMKKAFFTGVSPSVCREIEEIGINPESIAFISNGVDVQRFRPRDEGQLLRNKFGIPSGAKVLLSVGRLTYHKQPFTLLKIFSQLSQERDNFILCIVGSGELKDELEDYVQKNKIKRVFFLGHVDHKITLPDVYSHSDFFIITSSYEGGISLTLLEAMASGLPCIVSNIPNFYILQDAKCGIIVDFQDPKSVDRIYNYINSEQRLHSINARTYALKNLDWNIISERYLELFQFK